MFNHILCPNMSVKPISKMHKAHIQLLMMPDQAEQQCCCSSQDAVGNTGIHSAALAPAQDLCFRKGLGGF